MNIEGWSQLPDFVRKEAIEKAISTSRAQARKAITLSPDFLKRKLDAVQKDLDRKVGQAGQ